MGDSTLSPSPRKKRLTRRERDVRDCVEAYVALSAESGGYSVASSSICMAVSLKWGETYTDERYMAAENAMYDSPEVRAIGAAWRARVARAPVQRVPFYADTKAAVWDMTGGTCWYCGIQTNPFRDFTIDHVIPVSKGGSDDLSNLVPCCKSCNSKKGAR